MIDPVSFIGFGLAFLAAVWTASTLAWVACAMGRRALARLGPAAERAAAASALVLGPLLGVAVFGALAGQSLVALRWGSDHCAHHGHHPHLCLAHGGTWGGEPWAVVILAMVGAYLSVRVAQKVVGAWTAHRALRRLAGLASASCESVLIVPAGTAFCFVAGLLRPRIYASSAAWNALSAREREAVLAHERAHIAQGDVLRRALLGVAALLGAPWLASQVLAAWERATERLCDHQATHAVEAATVANALVSLSRMGAGPVPAGLSFASPADVVRRVEALLADTPSGVRGARVLSRAAWAVLILAAALAAAFADPLHHAIETFLGAL